ncbi:MAG: hypothetical protein JW741_06920 [Sedimentisphaerales bacterium]|nr:hypothetical protein [Sedimentisphaerales bacterium]
MGESVQSFCRGLMFVLVSSVILSSGLAAHETEVVYLSGQGKDDAVEWDFYCTAGRRSGQWTNIPVPSNWELQGFGTYNYGHDKPKADEQGKYKRTFDVPQTWTGRRIFLIFGGVMTDTEVRVNGKSAGPVHQGGFYRFKYEITDLVKPGENLLEVTVSKVSANASVETAERKADYWVFGGIFRPVYLEVLPPEFIDSIAIDARADGSFRMDVYLNGVADISIITALLIGPDGKCLAEPFEAEFSPAQEKVTLRTQVTGQKLWTAETPNLCEARITLRQGGRAVHRVTQRFGFRTFELRPGDGMYLNGQKIRLKGVCRHSFWPDSGRCLSKEISYADVRLIKEMNMNAVRMSHYPPDSHFLDACDELGLYVLDELAGWQKPPYDTDIGTKLVAEMVPRDVCHPSILFWDNGNEGGWNRDLDDQFALYDPQKRTVLHPWESFNGIDTDHYESYESIRKKLAGSTLFMPTEFLHGLYDGGHGAGLEDQWNLMSASPLGAGGFLWVLADEGVVRTDKDGKIDVDGNHAPDGIVGPYREKEGSFYTIKEIWSPVQVDPQRLGDDFNGAMEVENRYDFTNLRECVFEVKLAEFPAPGAGIDGHAVFFQRAFPGPDIKPHGEGTLDLGLPATWRDADVLYLTASDPTGREIWTWSWDIRPPDHYRRQCLTNTAAAGARVKATASGGRVSLETGDLTFGFDPNDATFTDLQVKGKPIAFGGGPTVIGGTAKPVKVRGVQDGNNVVIDVAYEGSLESARWTVCPSGWIRLEYTYELEGQFGLFGVHFEYPESRMKSMRWLGHGPYRVWKNRMKGGRLDLWSNAYKDHTPGLTWDFPEFRGYYRHWRWVVFETNEGTITIVNETPDLFLGVYRPKDGPDPSNTKLDAPETGIAFLHGIPAIGTKFQKPESLGPQGRKNEASGTYRGSVWFHFDN